jgi:hypothetical protein
LLVIIDRKDAEYLLHFLGAPVLRCTASIFPVL